MKTPFKTMICLWYGTVSYDGINLPEIDEFGQGVFVAID